MTEINPLSKFVTDHIALETVDPPIFDVKAPIKLAALSSDGRYRMIDLKDEEFFLKGVRPGKKSEWIIELAPISAAGYVHVELLDKDMAQVMPELEAHLSNIIGYPGMKFRNGVKKFFTALAAQKEQEAMQAESQKYDTNPSWGSF